MTIIPEPDVYRLIMQSHKPDAEQFEEWVVGTVLPSIRKTGSCGLQQFSRLDIARMLVASEEEKLALATTLREQAPKVRAYEVFISSEKTIKFEDLSAMLGTSARELCKRLREGEYLSRKRNSSGRGFKNLPMHEYLELGWFVRRIVPVEETGHLWPQTRVTPRGADEIRKLVEEGKL